MDARRHQRFQSDLTITLDQGDGVMRNVSASGLYFETKVDLRPGQRFRFALRFTALSVGVVRAQCEAVVVRTEGKGPINGVGAALQTIEFDLVDEASPV